MSATSIIPPELERQAVEAAQLMGARVLIVKDTAAEAAWLRRATGSIEAVRRVRPA